MSADLEPDARAINAEPWEPLPGMVKVRCVQCFYWFASHGATCCPDCEMRSARLAKRRARAATAAMLEAAD